MLEAWDVDYRGEAEQGGEDENRRNGYERESKVKTGKERGDY